MFVLRFNPAAAAHSQTSEAVQEMHKKSQTRASIAVAVEDKSSRFVSRRNDMSDEIEICYHEGGHFFVGPEVGVRTESVSIFSRSRGETAYHRENASDRDFAVFVVAGLAAECRLTGQPLSLRNFAHSDDGRLLCDLLHLARDSTPAALENSVELMDTFRRATVIIDRRWLEIAALAETLLDRYVGAGFQPVTITFLSRSSQPELAHEPIYASAQRPERPQFCIDIPAPGIAWFRGLQHSRFAQRRV
jgi:hypothetical protein